MSPEQDSVAQAHVDACGGLALVQDSGRLGMQYLGLAEGGAADAYAYFWSNQLVGNHPLRGHSHFASIEITLGPFSLTFDAPTLMAITGAEMQAQLNGSPIATWASHKVSTGDTLTLQYARSGLRAYISVAGGFVAPQHFGSWATVVREAALNIGAAPLQIGQFLPYRTCDLSTSILKRFLNPQYIPSYDGELTLRIFPSYQYHLFSPEQREQLTQSRYTITPESDRMGYCLKTETPLQHKHAIISEGIAYGSVQLPPDGQPIVLLNDRQTIGGYPKIGCVLKEDAYQLAQRRPGQTVKLVFLDSKE